MYTALRPILELSLISPDFPQEKIFSCYSRYTLDMLLNENCFGMQVLVKLCFDLHSSLNKLKKNYLELVPMWYICFGFYIFYVVVFLIIMFQ